VDHDLVDSVAVGEIGDEADLGGNLRVGHQHVEYLEALVLPGADDLEELGNLGMPASWQQPSDSGGMRGPRLLGQVPGDVLGEVREDAGEVAAAERLVHRGDGAHV
jgi:hypothetical protein